MSPNLLFAKFWMSEARNHCHHLFLFLQWTTEYLKKCNVVDTIDVLLRLHESYATGKKELVSEISRSCFLLQDSPCTPVEVSLCSSRKATSEISAQAVFQRTNRASSISVLAYSHRTQIGIRPELSGRIDIHFNGNWFGQFKTNSWPVWMGLKWLEHHTKVQVQASCHPICAKNRTLGEKKKSKQKILHLCFIFQLQEQICPFLCQKKKISLVQVEHPLDDSLVKGNTKVKMTGVASLQDACKSSQRMRSKSPKVSSVTEVGGADLLVMVRS